MQDSPQAPLLGTVGAAPSAAYGAAGPPPLVAPAAQEMASKDAPCMDGDDPAVSMPCPNHLSSFLCAVLLPCSLCRSIKQINVNEQSAALYWGEYVGTLTKPGLYCMNPYGLQLQTISTKRNTLHLKDIKVLDARGNPVVISGVVTFVGTSAKKATIDVNLPWPVPGYAKEQSFLELQASAVLKRVASRYPYEAPAGSPSLQSEGRSMGEELRQQLQEKVAVTGAHIFAFDLVDLSYATEIAHVMLVRQQAEALVDARRTLVSAAVNMTKDAVSGIGADNLDQRAQSQLTANLLTVICSGSAAVPTIAVGS